MKSQLLANSCVLFCCRTHLLHPQSTKCMSMCSFLRQFILVCWSPRRTFVRLLSWFYLWILNIWSLCTCSQTAKHFNWNSYDSKYNYWSFHAQNNNSFVRLYNCCRAVSPKKSGGEKDMSFRAWFILNSIGMNCVLICAYSKFIVFWWSMFQKRSQRRAVSNIFVDLHMCGICLWSLSAGHLPVVAAHTVKSYERCQSPRGYRHFNNAWIIQSKSIPIDLPGAAK